MKINDRVICINSVLPSEINGVLKEGIIYTIIGFNNYDGSLLLKEIDNEFKNFPLNKGYKKDRFRKIDETFSENVLKNITEKYLTQTELTLS